MRKIAGVAGRLAQKNAARNSRRTATTAAALMIGLTLVTTALVVGESVKATIGSTFERSAKADYYVTDDLDEVDFPASLAGELRQSDVVAAATGFTHFDARVDGTVTGVVGFDFDQIDAAARPRRPGRRVRPQRRAPGGRVRRRGDRDRRRAGRRDRPRGRQRIPRRGDDRRAVRRPGHPGRGLPVRHERPRRRRRRPDSRVARRLGRGGRATGRRRGARRRACPSSTRTRSSRPRTSSVNGSRAWSTRC